VISPEREDKVISTAQYSGYLQFKAKGASIAFVNAPEGLTATRSRGSIGRPFPAISASHGSCLWSACITKRSTDFSDISRQWVLAKA